MKRAMCVWLANWPIQRLLAARPELEHAAVLLHEPHRGNLARVVACSARAHAAGVKVGLPLAEATAVVEAAAHSDSRSWSSISRAAAQPVRPAATVASTFFCQPHDSRADRAALLRLATWSQQFSPLVGLEENDAPECLLLDVTGCQRLFHGEAALAAHVVEQFRRRGLHVQVAIADTVGAAWALARHLPDEMPARVVSSAGTAAALAPLPVSALRLPEETVRLLGQLGVARIGQLQRLPRASLSARFGPRLLERWDQALGRRSEMIVPHRPPETIRLDWSFEHPSERSEVLESVLQHLARELERRQQGAQRLQCRLHPERGEPVTLSVDLFRPSAAADHLWELVQMQLAHLRLLSAVTAARVEVPLAAPLECRQPDLFGDVGTGPEPLAVLVDRLTSRLGDTAVLQAQLVADPQPAYRCDPWVRLRRRAACEPESVAVGNYRPLQLQTPQPVSVMSVVPDGPPIRFHWRGREYQVSHAHGPERIKTGWWRSPCVRRDYYRTETTAGRFWLFRRLSDGAWFLQGRFD